MLAYELGLSSGLDYERRLFHSTFALVNLFLDRRVTLGGSQGRDGSISGKKKTSMEINLVSFDSMNYNVHGLNFWGPRFAQWAPI